MIHPHPRRQRTATAAIAVALLLGVAGPAPAQEQSFPAPQGFSEMVEAKLPSVLGIVATGPDPVAAQPSGPQLPPGLQDFFGMPRPDMAPQGPRQALGSGFFISADGYAVTNNHVIEGAEQIEIVIEDERRLPADLVGTDPATDIALLKVDAGDAPFPFVSWGQSRELEIGEWVVAIGNPFGLGGTVTSGIVSAQSRNINSGPFDDFIQTDAAINSGNSGGPLFDARGKVVGVNTAIYSPSGGNVGIGFAVPAHVASRIVADLRDDGEVTRGWLGVQIQPVSQAIANALGLESNTGALVNDVTASGPAEQAGIQSGDIVVAVNDQPITDPRDLIFAVADLEIGQDATFTLWRNGNKTDILVEIASQPGPAKVAMPTAPEGESGTPQLGVSVVPLTPEVRTRLQLPETLNGLVIEAVQPDSNAARAGLLSGDVIVQVGNTDIATVQTLRDALESANADDRPGLQRIYRAGRYQFVAVPLDQVSDG